MNIFHNIFILNLFLFKINNNFLKVTVCWIYFFYCIIFFKIIKNEKIYDFRKDI